MRSQSRRTARTLPVAQAVARAFACRSGFGLLLGGALIGAGTPTLAIAPSASVGVPALAIGTITRGGAARVSVTAAEDPDAVEHNPFLPPRANTPIQFAQAASDEPTLSESARAAAPDTPAAGSEAASSGITADVVGDDDFLPADELDVPLPSGPRPVPGAPAARESATGRWGMAPVRLGGVLSVGLRQNRVDEGSSQSSQMYEGRLRVNSYIMQPYIALVSGDFGLTLIRTQATGTGGAASSNLTGTSINGSGSVNVFPQSRFPFQATLALSDSRSDGTLTTTDTQRRRLSLRQDYRPAVGQWRTSGQYDRSELSGSFGRDVVDVLSADYSIQLGRQSVAVNGSWSSNRSSDNSATDLVGVLRHGFVYDDSLSFNTTASFTMQDFDRVGRGVGLRGESRSAQIFTFASWSPQDSPWRGSANLRYFDNQNTFGGGSSDNQSLSGSASLNYRASDNLSLFGTFSANVNASGGGRNVSTSQALGANYSGDTRMFGEYAYSWYGSGAVNNSTTSVGEGQRGASASLGHSLNRNWQPSAQTQLRGSVNQSISTNRSSGEGSTGSSTLSNSVSLSLQASPTDSISGFLSTSLSDSRSFGDNASTFQMLNTQLSGNWRIDRVSQLHSNLTWQLSRQTSSGGGPFGSRVESSSQSSSLSGNLGYQHGRAFGVRNLRYSADFRASTSDSSSRAGGDPDAGRDRVTLDLDQRLSYSIGRLSAEMQVRFGQVEGRGQGLIYFKVSRNFGAF